MTISKYRDLTIFDDIEKKLVIACDSAGGIGPKPLDQIQVSGYIVGRFLTRVALMELISVGAKPFTIIDTLSVEMEPTGREIISGIKVEASQLEIDVSAILNGSTEENIVVQQTGVGVTALGRAKKLYMASKKGDSVLCIGIPKVGDEVQLDDHQICNLVTINKVRKIEGVHEIVPVGSKGISFELNELLKRNQCSLESATTSLDLKKSGGPVTCALVTVDENQITLIKEICDQPVTYLGKLI